MNEGKNRIAAQTLLLNIREIIKKGFGRMTGCRKKILIMFGFLLAMLGLTIWQTVGLACSVGIVERA